MTAIDLVAMGEPMLEYNQRPGSEAGQHLYLEGFGGDTSNAAIAAARQGVHVAYVTALGVDAAGDRFLALWDSEGVDRSAVRRSRAQATAIYFVTHGAAGHGFHYYRTGSAASTLTPADVPEAMIAGARMFYASGISQAISPSAADAVFHAIAVARRHGVPVAYDTNYRPLLWPATRAAAIIHQAIALCDIALPGLDDARALTGLEDPDAIADFYLALGPRVVVLKMGAAGAMLATATERVRIPPFPTTLVDATGAGDTFCGSFLARTILGDDPLAAARYAAAAAAIQCGGFGAVTPIPHADQVRAALEAG